MTTEADRTGESNISWQVEEAEDGIKERCPFIKARFIQLSLITVVRAFVYGSRGVLPIAIVAMTTENTSSNPNVPVYNWTNISIILSSFYWSYAIIQFFSSWIAHSHGPKWYLLVACFLDSGINLVIPVVSENFGGSGLIVCRVLQGFAQGLAIPLLMQLMGRWVPTNERTWMCSIYAVGINVGIILTKLSSGYMAASWAGWPVIFYTFGSIGILICILFLIFGYNKPADHSRMSSKERHYIETSLGQDRPLQVKSIPWRAILSSLPFWAVVLAAIGESWETTLTTTELPTYFSKILLLDITANGVLSTITNGSGAITTLLSGPFIDYLINHNYIHRSSARRVFNGIGLFIPAVCLVAVTYISNDYNTVVALLVITYVARACIQHLINILDISPIYSGIIMGVANGFGQLIAIFAPIAVQLIVYDESDVTQWRTVFMLSAGILIGTGIFYSLFMSGDRQWWDSGDKELEKDKKILT